MVSVMMLLLMGSAAAQSETDKQHLKMTGYLVEDTKTIIYMMERMSEQMEERDRKMEERDRKREEVIDEMKVQINERDKKMEEKDKKLQEMEIRQIQMQETIQELLVRISLVGTPAIS